MTGFYPVPATRSTNLLQQTRLIQQLNNDQLALQRLQNQISTGHRISGAERRCLRRPACANHSAAAGAEGAGQDQYASGAVVSRRHRYGPIAVCQVADGCSFGAAWPRPATRPRDAVRQAWSKQVDAAISQLLNTANQNFRGRYLFAGSRSGAAPFEQTADGIVYHGNEGSLDSFVDLDLAYATNAPRQRRVWGVFVASARARWISIRR